MIFKNRKLFLLSLSLSVLFFSAATPGSELTIPNTFTAGTLARAAEVNANFNEVSTAVNDNNTRVAELETQNADLVARLEVLENFIGQLQQSLSLETDNQGNPTVVFSGVNVHINNGENATATVNGLGNLVIGYDETRTGVFVCSDGRYASQGVCENNGNVWAVSHKSGSHTLVIGPGHSYSQWGGLLAGYRNVVNGIAAAVSGGSDNQAGGAYSSVSGGGTNRASGANSSVSGGFINITTAGADHASVSGGVLKLANGEYDWAAGSLYEDE
jgi:hypothetical protein